jgi:hypothetical protein
MSTQDAGVIPHNMSLLAASPNVLPWGASQGGRTFTEQTTYAPPWLAPTNWNFREVERGSNCCLDNNCIVGLGLLSNKGGTGQ